MKHIHCSLFVYLLLICQFRYVYSIECCLDSACVERVVDCAVNICFKLTMKLPNKQTEERGCMKDLMGILHQKMDGQNLHDDTGGSCQKFEGPIEMNLCKCTSNLCNSSRRLSSNSAGLLFLLAFLRSIYYSSSHLFD